MNAEKQRIAIAEVCGTDLWQNRPNYLNDLNAMHEAEKVLTPGQRVTYIAILLPITGTVQQDLWFCAHATAAQKAESFLRCLNLWEPAPHD